MPDCSCCKDAKPATIWCLQKSNGAILWRFDGGPEPMLDVSSDALGRAYTVQQKLDDNTGYYTDCYTIFGTTGRVYRRHFGTSTMGSPLNTNGVPNIWFFKIAANPHVSHCTWFATVHTPQPPNFLAFPNKLCARNTDDGSVIWTMNQTQGFCPRVLIDRDTQFVLTSSGGVTTARKGDDGSGVWSRLIGGNSDIAISTQGDRVYSLGPGLLSKAFYSNEIGMGANGTSGQTISGDVGYRIGSTATRVVTQRAYLFSAWSPGTGALLNGFGPPVQMGTVASPQSGGPFQDVKCGPDFTLIGIDNLIFYTKSDQQDGKGITRTIWTHEFPKTGRLRAMSISPDGAFIYVCGDRMTH